MARHVDERDGAGISPFQYELLNELLRELECYTCSSRQFFEWPAHNPVFILLMQNTKNVHPRTTRGLGASPKVGVRPPVGWIELEGWALHASALPPSSARNRANPDKIVV